MGSEVVELVGEGVDPEVDSVEVVVGEVPRCVELVSPCAFRFRATDFLPLPMPRRAGRWVRRPVRCGACIDAPSRNGDLRGIGALACRSLVGETGPVVEWAGFVSLALSTIGLSAPQCAATWGGVNCMEARPTDASTNSMHAWMALKVSSPCSNNAWRGRKAYSTACEKPPRWRRATMPRDAAAGCGSTATVTRGGSSVGVDAEPRAGGTARYRS